MWRVLSIQWKFQIIKNDYFNDKNSSFSVSSLCSREWKWLLCHCWKCEFQAKISSEGVRVPPHIHHQQGCPNRNQNQYQLNWSSPWFQSEPNWYWFSVPWTRTNYLILIFWTTDRTNYRPARPDIPTHQTWFSRSVRQYG